MYSYDRTGKLSPQQRGWEKRREQDERARNNIPPEYQGAWDKLKRKFRGNPDQRAERFMEYMEENPSERDEVLQEKADKDVARMVREQKREFQRAERERKQREREEKKRKRMEMQCEKLQTRYDDALRKEQDRAEKMDEKLQVLREKADTLCQNCPTCEGYRGRDDGPLPFAASVKRVVARYRALGLDG